MVIVVNDFKKVIPHLYSLDAHVNSWRYYNNVLINFPGTKRDGHPNITDGNR